MCVCVCMRSSFTMCIFADSNMFLVLLGFAESRFYGLHAAVMIIEQ